MHYIFKALFLTLVNLCSIIGTATFANEEAIDLRAPSASAPATAVACKTVIIKVGILSSDPPQPAWKDFTTQNLVEHLRDQAYWMRRTGAKRNPFLAYARDVVTSEAVNLRDLQSPMPAIGSEAWKRLLISSRVLQIFVNDPYHLVNNTELAGVEDALVRFLRSKEPLWESFNDLDKSLRLFYRYHRKSTLVEWMGMRLDGTVLYQ